MKRYRQLMFCLLVTFLFISFQLFRSVHFPTTKYESDVPNKPFLVPNKPFDVPNKQFIAQNKRPITLALLRSIGNALPPRHRSSQTLDNLNFTLLNEPSFPNVQKHWVLNRLVNKKVEQQVLNMLEEYHQNYTIIPFDLKVYSKLKLNFELFEPNGALDYAHDRFYMFEGNPLYDQALESAKNLYVCNVNGGRNTMIDIGLSMGVTWILPWDGNAFVTYEGFDALTKALRTHKAKYFVTPAHRVVGKNEQILNPNYIRPPSEEPMISFRNDSVGRFHPMLWYGRRNKVELLLRLKIPGVWDMAYNFSRWEKRKFSPPLNAPLPDRGNQPIPALGWSFRLNSGNPHLEVRGQAEKRMNARTQSVTLLFNKLDARVLKELHGYSNTTLLFYNQTSLAQDRLLFQSKDPNISSMQAQLLSLADKALSVGPWSVMDKPIQRCVASNDCHYYHSRHPHFWYVRGNGTKGQFISDKSRTVPEADLYGFSSDQYDRSRLCSLQYNTTVLALAYIMTENITYASHAAEMIRTWFVKAETRMKPNLRYARFTPASESKLGPPQGIIEMKDLYHLLDAIRILQQAGVLSENDQSALHTWFTQYLEWLSSTTAGQHEYLAQDHRGIYFDIQIVSVAAFVGNTSSMLWYLDRSMSRLKKHINEKGRMPRETVGSTCEHNQLFALEAWFTLARIGKSLGRNVWDAYPTLVNDSRLSALCRAAYFSIPYFREREECEGNLRVEPVTRWWPLWYEAQRHCPGLPKVTSETFPGNNTVHNDTNAFLGEFLKAPPPQSHYLIPSVLHPYNGMAPFWNLGIPVLVKP